MADSIRHLIEEAVKSSMRERNKDRTSTLRMALSELKKEEIDNKIELSNEGSIKILQRMIKQRKESMSQFLNAQRNDLAEKEESEIVILQDFLPEQMSVDDINKLVIEAINETDAKEAQDIGKVMGFLKTKIQGNADMGVVSKLVKENLQG
tara:strand:- start:32 stop:484 length:453 start_codon:yes stop_codon:yes gene_type:complete